MSTNATSATAQNAPPARGIRSSPVPTATLRASGSAPTTTCELVPDGAGSDYEQDTDTILVTNGGAVVPTLVVDSDQVQNQVPYRTTDRRSPVEFTHGVARINENPTASDTSLATPATFNGVRASDVQQQQQQQRMTSIQRDTQQTENSGRRLPVLPYIISATPSSTLGSPAAGVLVSASSSPAVLHPQPQRGSIQNVNTPDNVSANPMVNTTNDSLYTEDTGDAYRQPTTFRRSSDGSMLQHSGSYPTSNQYERRTLFSPGNAPTPAISTSPYNSVHGYLRSERSNNDESPSSSQPFDASLQRQQPLRSSQAPQLLGQTSERSANAASTALIGSNKPPRAQPTAYRFRDQSFPSTVREGYNDSIWSQSQQADEINQQLLPGWPTPTFSSQRRTQSDRLEQPFANPFERQSPPVVVPTLSPGRNKDKYGEVNTTRTTEVPTKPGVVGPVTDTAVVPSNQSSFLAETTVPSPVVPTTSGAFDLVKRSIYSTIILDKYCRFEETIQRRNLKRSFDVYNAEAYYSAEERPKHQPPLRPSSSLSKSSDKSGRCRKEECCEINGRLATLWSTDTGSLQQFLVAQRRSVMEQLNQLTTAEQVQTLSAMSIAYNASRDEDQDEASATIANQCSISSIVRDVIFDTLESDSVKTTVDPYVSMKSVKRLVESLLIELEPPKSTTKRQRVSQTVSDLNLAFGAPDQGLNGHNSHEHNAQLLSNEFGGGYGGRPEPTETSQQWLQRVLKKVAAAGACVLGSVVLRHCCGKSASPDDKSPKGVDHSSPSGGDEMTTKYPATSAQESVGSPTSSSMNDPTEIRSRLRLPTTTTTTTRHESSLSRSLKSPVVGREALSMDTTTGSTSTAEPLKSPADLACVSVGSEIVHEQHDKSTGSADTVMTNASTCKVINTSVIPDKTEMNIRNSFSNNNNTTAAVGASTSRSTTPSQSSRTRVESESNDSSVFNVAARDSEPSNSLGSLVVVHNPAKNREICKTGYGKGTPKRRREAKAIGSQLPTVISP